LYLKAMSLKTDHDMMQRAIQNMKGPTTADAGVTHLSTAGAGRDNFACSIDLCTDWGLYVCHQPKRPVRHLPI